MIASGASAGETRLVFTTSRSWIPGVLLETAAPTRCIVWNNNPLALSILISKETYIKITSPPAYKTSPLPSAKSNFSTFHGEDGWLHRALPRFAVWKPWSFQLTFSGARKDDRSEGWRSPITFRKFATSPHQRLTIFSKPVLRLDEHSKQGPGNGREP